MGARPSRYEQRGFGGRNRFWLQGRCVTGPDYRGTALTLLLIVSITLLSVGITFPYLIRTVPKAGIPLLVVVLVSVAIALWSCWLAATTDPGIIPRSSAPPPPARRDRTIVIRGRTVLIKFCETCRIWRPPRASHCATCNNCVQRFDHHCPWLGNDIGIRNYRSYFTFVSSAAVASGCVIAAAVWHLVAKTAEFADGGTTPYAEALRRTLSNGPTAVNLFLIFLCILAFAFTGGLTGFHIYLMSNNVTTAESFKKSARNSAYEHDDLRGCAAIYFLQCSQRPVSAISQGFSGDPYPDYDLIQELIAKQIEEESIAQQSAPAAQASSSGRMAKFIERSSDNLPQVNGAAPPRPAKEPMERPKVPPKPLPTQIQLPRRPAEGDTTSAAQDAEIDPEAHSDDMV